MTILQRIHYVWVRAGLFVFVASPFVAFLMFRPWNLPPQTLVSTSATRVSDSEIAVRFEPGDRQTAAGVLLLPGCPVDPYAYTPLARMLADAGTLAVVVKVPYRCAPSPTHEAELQQRVAALTESCTDCRWTLAGHSRGAAHALRLVSALPARIRGLVLIGSTHPREVSYAHLTIPVMKIVATNDGVAPLDASLANRPLLPASVRWEVIDGGNHSQFGYYSFQLFDHRATITREAQHEQTAALITSFVRESISR